MFCRECGEKLEQGAKFCERCGAPVGVAAAGGTAAGVERGGGVPPGKVANGTPRAPGWVYALLPAMLIVGLAVGFVIGYLVAPEGGGPVAEATTTLSMPASTTLVTSVEPTTLSTTTTLLPTTTSTMVTTTTLPSTTTTKPPTTTTWPDYVTEWPMSKSGWTVQVAKFDGANPFSEDWAYEKAEEVLADHLPAGVLYSSDFSSIQEGWYVVFSGVFSSKSAAQSHRNKVLAKGFSEAVVIQVVPK